MIDETPQLLLVEDNEGDIVLIQEAFEDRSLKVEITVARNGKEALDMLEGTGGSSTVIKPDLIILDINIPIFSGHEVLKKIKEDPELRKIPVIILSTSADLRDIDQAYKNHCNCYIEKPIGINGLMETVAQIEQFWLQLTTLPK